MVVWYSHLLKNFPEFVVIYTVKGFGIINKAEVSLTTTERKAKSNVRDRRDSQIFGSPALIFP